MRELERRRTRRRSRRRSPSRPSVPRPGDERASRPVASDHRTVDAQAHVAPLRRAVPRSPCRRRTRTPSAPPSRARRQRPARRTSPAPPRASPAGRTRRRPPAGIVALEQHGQQVGDVAVVAGVAVLAREPHLGAVEQVEPAGVLAIAKARAARESGSRLDELAAARIASGAIPIPPPTRIAPAAPGEQLTGRGEGRPSGPVIQSASPGLTEARRSVPGPTASTRKSSPAPSDRSLRCARPRRLAADRACPRGPPQRSAAAACRTGPARASGPSVSSTENTR